MAGRLWPVSWKPYWQPCGSSILANTRLLSSEQSKTEATDYLVEQLRKHPTMSWLSQNFFRHVSNENNLV